MLQEFRPHVVALMQDQSGNYVVQCLLNLGQPAAFVLAAFHRHMLEIGTSRFGARALKSALASRAVNDSSKRHLFRQMCAEARALVRDDHGIILLHWLLDTHGPDMTASLASQLRGQFGPLSFSKPTATIVSRLLEGTSIARPLIIQELLDGMLADMGRVWASPVAASVLIKALSIVQGELASNRALVRQARKLCGRIASMSEQHPASRLHQQGLRRRAERLLRDPAAGPWPHSLD